MNPAHAAAIQQHLRERGIRGCSTCGESDLEPVIDGYLSFEPLDAALCKRRVVMVACKKCGRILFFSADAIPGLT